MRWYRWLVVTCLVAGFVLRARDFLYSAHGLWLDEATWTTRLLAATWLEPSIRPVGFTVVTRLLVECFGARDVVVRLLPWLAGVGAMLLSVPLAEVLLPNRASRLLFIGSLALHPVAIDYSKEFKPYSLSLCLHLTCLLFAARYLRAPRTSTLVLGMLTGFVGLWFSQDVIFALPGLYLVMGALAWRQRRSRHLVVLASGAAGTIALILCLYFFFWRALDVGAGQASTDFWANKYDVFYVAGPDEGFFHWIARKYLDIAAFPAARRESWQADGLFGTRMIHAASTLYAALWIGLHALGVLVLVRQRRVSTLALVALPLATLLVFGCLDLWPFGAFRTNLFLLAYVLPLAAFALAASPALHLARHEVWPLLVAVALPLVVFERDWHAHKRWGGESGFFDVVHELVKMQGPRAHGEPLVLDRHSCAVFRYYLSLNPDYETLRHKFAHRFARKCPTGEEALTAAEHQASDRRVWLVLSDHDSAATLGRIAGIANMVDYRKLDDGRDAILELAPPGWRAQ